MTRELFELDVTQGPAAALHERALEHIEKSYPWETLDPSRYPPLLVERARLGWTENAFNEFCTAIAMGQLINVLGQARVPLDLWSLDSSSDSAASARRSLFPSCLDACAQQHIRSRVPC